MKTFKQKIQSAGVSLVVALVIGFGVTTTSQKAYADDTEIFFGEAKTANLMLVLDESGSMSFAADGSEEVTEGEVIVDSWAQRNKITIDQARSLLPDPAGNPKARFPTLQVELDACLNWSWGWCAEWGKKWVNYTPYKTQNELKNWGVDVTERLDGGYNYRWVYLDNRMTRLKEALYIFLTSETTKDNNQIGMMSYSGTRSPNVVLLQEIRVLDKMTSGLTHREHLINSIHDLNPSFGTPTADGYYSATQYMGGAYTQNGQPVPSPILEGACGYNSSIVLLTDGLPTEFDDGVHSDYDKVIDFCDESVDASDQTDTNNGKQCIEKLSAHYFVNDIKSNFPGSTVQTSTVAFALQDEVATNFLKRTASTVNGTHLFFAPTDVDSLVRSFDESLNAVQDTTSFVAPSIPLSQFNRLRHSNNLYMGMFKPSANETWFGNLKKYQLEKGIIVDKDGTQAVDAETGTFIEESKSFWGDVADGNIIEKGGALPHITVGENAKVYTNLNTDELNLITEEFITTYIAANATEPDFQDRLFGSDTTSSFPDLTPEQLNKYYTWIRERVTSLDGVAINRFGDILHSKPEILEYDVDTSTAFVATNQGYVHAIDINTGQERWAFFPRQMMKKVPTWITNSVVDYDNETREYGLDGTISVHSEEVNGVKKHYLYFGQRRGGNYVFGLDVTNPTAPKMLFTVGDEFEFTKAELDYQDEKRTVIPNLGQSWLKPVVLKMHSGNAEGFEKRLILAGGYDTYYDDRANPINPADNVIKGDGIYDIPYLGSASDTDYSVIAEESVIDNSFAGDLTFIDIDNDQIVDHIYAADVAGKIYRVDFTKESTTRNVELFANVQTEAADGPYRFYSKPDVAFATYSGKSFAVVTLGSGHRANPKAEATQDRYYAFYDFEITKVEESGDVDPITPSSLLDVTTATIDPETNETAFADVSDIFKEGEEKKGWYFDLQPKEKVLSSSTTLDFTTLFTTYIPGPPGCGVTSGVNRLYGVNLLDGKPSVGGFEVGDVADMQDRYTNVKYVGIAPGATALFPEDETFALLVGTQTVCTGDDCDFFTPNVRTIKWKQQE
ncbi:MAG TPA: PilC/PilY family type IV pilus protein [Kangiella sp.]